MRSYGHLPDVEMPGGPDIIAADLASKHAGILVGSVRTAAKADLRHLCEHVRDQQSASACVGFGLGGAIELVANDIGRSMGPISYLAIYTGARAILRPYPLVLFDDGTYPRAAMLALGDPEHSIIVPEKVWPFSLETVNHRLPLDVYQAADGLKVDYYRIGSAGEHRCDAIRKALSMRRPVTFAMDVDRAYEDHGGTAVYEGGGKSLGSHEQVIVGFSESAFIVRNSWGTAWGDGGYAYVSPDFIGSDKCSDFYVLTDVEGP